MIYSLFFTLVLFNADSQVGGRTSPDGVEQLQIDLPASEHLKNVGGRDGSGLCVFTSVEHSGRWQNVEQLTGFQSKMKKEDGGGWAVFLLSPPPPPPPSANARYNQAPEPDEAPAPPATPEPFLFGVELNKTTEKGCWHNGRKITAGEAESILEGGTLTDDSNKLRITIIGDPEKTRRPKADLEASAWGPNVLVQAYTADAWAVTQIGLPTTGEPRIVVQAPPGPDGSAIVLHSQADYTDGIEGLIGALRRKAPNYDPNKDKDGRKGPDATTTSTLALARAVTVTALVAFVLGWFANRIVPAAVAAITTAHAKTFPAKPSMEEMILNALKTLKAQEAAANVDSTNTKPS